MERVVGRSGAGVSVETVAPALASGIVFGIVGVELAGIPGALALGFMGVLIAHVWRRGT